MRAEPLPSAELLNSLLEYDPHTGVLIWKPRASSLFEDLRTSAETKAKAWNNQNARKLAFISTSTNGYLKGAIFGRTLLAHRVIWKMVYGCDPDQIDHINGDRANNRLANLRSVSSSLNNRNRRRPVTNTSGHIGVSFNSVEGRYTAYLRGSNGKRLHVGYFKSAEEAAAARKSAERGLGYGPSHGRAA